MQKVDRFTPRWVLLSIAGFLTIHVQAQELDFNLEVDVVLDTVLYDGFEGFEMDIPEGFRRYRVYAVLPAENDLMLGVAADDVSDPVIPGFGYDAGCGCFNFISPLLAPFGYNNAGYINAELFTIIPELEFDTWWTSHVSEATPGTVVFEPPVTFPPGYNSCTDIVAQGALIVTNADPIHNTVTDGRALIGQITTCESFSFQVCVAFQSGFDVITSCTDGEVTVEDLCAPLEELEAVVEDGLSVQGGAGLPSTMLYSLEDESGSIFLSSSEPFQNLELPPGPYSLLAQDTGRVAAWSSNTCRREFEFFVYPEEMMGCTVEGAFNFNASANHDDGSCLIGGCMDTLALNYNTMATVSGVCVYSPPDCPWDADLEVWPCASGCESDVNGDGELTIADLLSLLGDFGAPCGLQVVSFESGVHGSGELADELSLDLDSASYYPGCTYEMAVNFDPSANIDDGSCLRLGCMNPAAINFNPLANLGAPCILPLPNCFWDVAGGEWICPTACAADINADGLVNVPDLLVLLGDFAVGCD